MTQPRFSMDEKAENVKFKIKKCKGCGAPIFFAGGMPWYAKRVPILVEEQVENTEHGTRIISHRRETGYVSHFVNCQKASDFSKRNTR